MADSSAVSTIVSVVASNLSAIFTGAAALVASIAAMRGASGKRVRAGQQTELLKELEKVKATLADATRQRDEISATLVAEQKKCNERMAKYITINEELTRIAAGR